MIEKLDKIMEERGFSKADLARGTELPYTTIDGLWKKNSENTKRSTLIKIARFLNISLDYLADDNFEEDSYYFDPEVAAMAEELKNNPEYRVLLDAGRKLNKKQMKKITELIDLMNEESDANHAE